MEINNVSMGSSSPETWHIAWNGNIMARPSLNMVTGRLWISTEVATISDDRRTSIRDIKKKGEDGSWGYVTYMQQNPNYDIDVIYWHQYSASHHYSNSTP